METILYEGKFISMKKRGTWEYVTRKNCTGDAVIIVALTTAGELILVSQNRPPLNADVLEWPAGLIGDDGDSDVMRAAARELEEECGYQAEKLVPLISGVCTPGLTDEKQHLVAALNCKKIGAGGGVDGENITTHVLPRAKLGQFVHEWQKKNGIVDIKIYAGLNLVDGLNV